MLSKTNSKNQITDFSTEVLENEKAVKGINFYCHYYCYTNRGLVVIFVNGVKTNYYLNGTDIIEQTDGTNTLHFYYDNTGEIIGFTYNSNQYFYIKNVQNDIIAIADSSGNIVSEYAYDPWGAVISVTGSNTEIGNLNPFRYRSYYYDSEIGMYYLQSRYYDPEICRFINGDDVNYIGFTESEISYNPFAYCENNAVNYSDEEGNCRKQITIKTLEDYLKYKNKCKKAKWGKTRVSITVSGNDIVISANFKISGDLKDIYIDGCTYASWFIEGVKNYWKGSFVIYGYKVNLETKAKQQKWKSSLTVKMSKKISVSKTDSADRVFWKPGKNCKICLYKGDKRVDKDPYDSVKGYIYSGAEFSWVSAHEFGHVLGLADQGDNTEGTIMGAMNEHVSTDDVKTVLLSFIKKKFNGGT